MARRRQKNPLLAKILLISLAVHAIALPVLAHYGAFSKISRVFGASQVVMIAPAPEERPKEKVPAKQAKKAENQPATKKGASAPSHSAARQHSNLNQPAVVASGPGSGGTGPAIEQGTGKAGEVPTVKPKGPPEAGAPTGSAPSTSPRNETTPQPTASPTPKPAEPTPAAPKRVPVYREAEATYQPEPVIPDEFRAEALDKTCVLELTVGDSGAVTSARVSTSCGIRELDELALRTAKTWRFQPATADGAPMEGHVRLRIEFRVE